MYIKKFVIRYKTFSQKAGGTPAYDGMCEVANLALYNMEGTELLNTNVNYTSGANEASFIVGGNVKGTVSCYRGYSTSYGAANALKGAGSYCASCSNNSITEEQQGIFFEFEKPINISKITFNTGGVVGELGNKLCMYLNDSNFAFIEDMNIDQTKITTITVPLKLESFEKTEEPGVVYYIQEDI